MEPKRESTLKQLPLAGKGLEEPKQLYIECNKLLLAVFPPMIQGARSRGGPSLFKHVGMNPETISQLIIRQTFMSLPMSRQQ